MNKAILRRFTLFAKNSIESFKKRVELDKQKQIAVCVANKIRPLSLNLAHWFSSCEFFFTARKLWVDAFVREKRVGVIGPVG